MNSFTVYHNLVIKKTFPALGISAGPKANVNPWQRRSSAAVDPQCRSGINQANETDEQLQANCSHRGNTCTVTESDKEKAALPFVFFGLLPFTCCTITVTALFVSLYTDLSFALSPTSVKLMLCFQTLSENEDRSERAFYKIC